MQFAIGGVSAIGGFVVIVTTSPTGIGLPLALSGVVLMGYGIENVVASFSDYPGAAEALGHPSNLSGVGGRIVAGERGQAIAGTVEDVITARGAKSIFDKVNSSVALAKDGYDLFNVFNPTAPISAPRTTPSTDGAVDFGGYDLGGGKIIPADRVGVTGGEVPQSGDNGSGGSDGNTPGASPGSPNANRPKGPANWGGAGFPVPTGGTLGPGGIAAFGPDAVFGATYGPGVLGLLGLGGGSGVNSITMRSL